MLRKGLILRLSLEHTLCDGNEGCQEQHDEHNGEQSNHNVTVADEGAQFTLTIAVAVRDGPRDRKDAVTVLACTPADGVKGRNQEVEALRVLSSTEVGEDRVAFTTSTLCRASLNTPSGVCGSDLAAISSETSATNVTARTAAKAVDLELLVTIVKKVVSMVGGREEA